MTDGVLTAEARLAELVARATEWLEVGGFFNPELMENGSAQQLVIELRNALANRSLSQQPVLDDDIGLSVDMLDVDRLRDWARLLLTHGRDVTHWASVPHLASRMQTLATGLEKAVRDIGTLRAELSRWRSAHPPQRLDAKRIGADMVAEMLQAAKGEDGVDFTDEQRLWVEQAASDAAQEVINRWRSAHGSREAEEE